METTSINRARIFKRDNWTCLYCGVSGIKGQVALHADHVIPFASGGSNEASNIGTACASCNIQKKDSYLEQSDIESLLALIAKRNAEDNIKQDSQVQGVRTKKNGVLPQKTYSARLTEEEAAYCVSVSGTVTKFLKDMVQAHIASKGKSRTQYKMRVAATELVKEGQKKYTEDSKRWRLAVAIPPPGPKGELGKDKARSMQKWPKQKNNPFRTEPGVKTMTVMSFDPDEYVPD